MPTNTPSAAHPDPAGAGRPAGHVDNTVATQLNELRLIRQNIANIQYEEEEN